MPELKLLKFYFSTSEDWWHYKWHKERKKVKIICEGLESLPDELRYLCWHGCPLKSLPLKFNPEHLVDLEIPYSKLQSIPLKDTKFLGKLKRIDLSECRQLTEVPDLSQATNLESMVLNCCSSLTKFPKISSNVKELYLNGTAIEEVPYSAIKCLSKIVSLDISFNRRLRNLPNMRHLTSLETLYLNGCSNITEFPDVSGAITCLYLRETAIEEVLYSAIKSLSKIVTLDMGSNTMLRNLPSMHHLTSLETLCLDGCSNITEFPDVSGAINCLYLRETAIEEVPYSAIKCLSKIVVLDMRSNTMLRNLPSMRHFTSLDKLDLHGCSNITEFPDVSKEIVLLYLSETGIEEVPSFVERLTNLRVLSLENCKRLKKVSSCIFQLNLEDNASLGMAGRLDLSGCSKLEKFVEVLENEGMLPSYRTRVLSMRYCKNLNLESLRNSLCNLTNLSELDLSGCPGVEKKLENVLLSSPLGLYSLRILDLSECNMVVLPNALSRLSSLEFLSLRRNEFESLNLELFTSLRRLDISYCKRLRYLQDFPLPSRLDVLVASHCTSLETLPDTNGVPANDRCFYYYHNCFTLDESAHINIQADAQLRTQRMGSSSFLGHHILIKYPTTNELLKEEGRDSFCFPGSEIPEWFIYQNQRSSIKIDLPPHWYNNKFVGFVVCIVASCESRIHIGHSYVECECKIKDPDCDGQDITYRFPYTVIEHPKSDHVFIKSIMPGSVLVDRKSDGSFFNMSDPRFNTENSFSWQKARFRFSTSNDCCKVKKCGINLVYSEWEDQVFETLMMLSERRKKNFFSGWPSLLFIFIFSLVMFLFHSLNIYK
ncbi:hypothetical protein Dsin_032663 [Dipteronia sinensis]|uniref:C-JID domain-containing protein n=1 Tax=Dipteronia sinensis TaxID=43782 RepID=A0AAD9Z5B5_9ROSI|nr:hypothetical protein Dsin_032663 [Dipteronia sinensis]